MTGRDKVEEGMVGEDVQDPCHQDEGGVHHHQDDGEEVIVEAGQIHHTDVGQGHQLIEEERTGEVCSEKTCHYTEIYVF